MTAILLSLIAGSAFAWLALRPGLARARAETERARAGLAEMQVRAAAAEARLEAEQRAAGEKANLLDAKFQALAAEILDKKGLVLQQQNQSTLELLLQPLKEKFGEFQSSVTRLSEQGVENRTELKKELEQLRALNQQLSQDAASLVTALKGSTKAQGNWGEMLLERLLEASGLREGHEYRRQASFARPDGGRAQPDVIVDLPGGRQLVVDAKLSLLAYERYCRVTADAERAAALKDHIASLRGHIRDLGAQQYQALPGLQTLDFVLLFVPIEPAFLLALSSDDRLAAEAAERNIMLVSPTTLLFALRTVAFTWRQDQQTRNVQKIVERGGEMYEKLRLFLESMTKVDTALAAARDNYDEAVRRLSSGKGNVIRQAEMLRELGVNPAKALPPAWVETAREEDDIAPPQARGANARG